MKAQNYAMDLALSVTPTREWTLREIRELTGISVEGIRQIEIRAIKKLRWKFQYEIKEEGL